MSFGSASIRSRSVFDIVGKEEKVARLQKKSSQPGFWDDSEAAQRVMQHLAGLQEEVSFWQELSQRTSDAMELLALATLEEDADADVLAELATEAEEIAAALGKAEFRAWLSGEHDKADAILAIHAGAGGTEAQDWAAMLLRILPGEEAGIKRAAVSVLGPYAYGYLRSERGVHRLVRLSPFDAAHRRHTSFSLVEVWPDLGEDIEIEIKPDDVKMEVYRSSGAGGQHMQKNSTAVRLIHLPTGIIVTCENERSQVQNREVAMKILRGRLYEMEKTKQEEEQARLKGEHVEAGWGNQIRSYVLQPYNMVKDLRTGFETGNTAAVLDGDLDAFIEAYLKMQVGR